MWKIVNGKLIQTTDDTRIRYKTRISAAMVEQLKVLAAENDTFIGYLLENGYSKLLQNATITYNKKTRPKDRIEFRTTCDKELLQAMKDFAEQHHLNLNDCIEVSISFINAEEVKNASWRYRVEL
ncbi:rRNA methyltransferase [Lysinibacillus sp. 2017]|uniref:rRNA methyltransferase n=1 Tax=unclassified Lysinibacillus TaxID=2636778 RepID=UPI000D52694D|nr:MULTISPECIES: rRNA methyltransferase [unclassified Lysinibacillus]AWE07503.1 rRNA methyltransferase [Lysinibacillus sp. 2017]TGN36665.1 rRNA methyltransferase [Lysinibacillus sp. S2017]